MTKFLLFGGTSVDFYAYTKGLEKISISSTSTQQLVCLPFGSKTLIEDLHLHPGGSAANASIGLKHLGSNSTIISSIGTDSMGQMLISNLLKNKVDIQYIAKIKNKKTAMSIILLYPDGEKSLLTYKGANDDLTTTHLPKKSIEQNDVLIFTSLPSNENFKLFKLAVELAQINRKKIVFAPSITMISKQLGQLTKMHDKFEIAIMNAEESEEYTGKKNIVESIKSLPGKVKVVTDAKNGAYACYNKQIFHIPSAKVKIIDTTGAGDSFMAGFSHYYFSKINTTSKLTETGMIDTITESLKFASAVSAIKMQTEGAHFNKSETDVKQFLKKHTELRIRKI